MGTDVRFGLHQQLSPTSAPPVTQDYTDATGLGGATGKGAIFFGSTAAAVNTERTNYFPYIGATDGVNQFVVATGDVTGTGNQSGSRRAATNETIMNNNSGTISWEAAFSALIANGVRVNWTTVDAATARLQNAILIGGADALVKVGTVAVSASSGGDVTVDLSTGTPTWPTTALPHIVIFITNGNVPFTDASSGGYGFNVGLAHNGGSITQRAFYMEGQLTSDPTSYRGGLRGDRIAGRPVDSHGATLQSFNAAPNPGFTIRSTVASLGYTLGYIALHFGDLQSSIYDLVTPTSVDTVTLSTGYQPQFLFNVQTMFEGALPQGGTGGNAASWGVSAVLPHIETCMAGWGEHGTANLAAPDDVTRVSQMQKATACYIRPHTGARNGTTDDIEATGPSGSGAFNSSNAQLAFSRVNPAGKNWIGFAVAASGVVGHPAGRRMGGVVGVRRSYGRSGVNIF